MRARRSGGLAPHQIPNGEHFPNNSMTISKIAVFVALVCLIAVPRQALSVSSTESPQNAWLFQTGSGSLYFGSPAEMAAFYVQNAVTLGQPTPVYLINITGPYTTLLGSVACSASNPCYTPNFEYTDNQRGVRAHRSIRGHNGCLWTRVSGRKLCFQWTSLHRKKQGLGVCCVQFS